MDFERLGPQEQSSRVHGVRFDKKPCIAEWVTKMNQNESPNGSPNGAKSSPWALLGLTLVILEGLWRLSFFDDFLIGKK